MGGSARGLTWNAIPIALLALSVACTKSIEFAPWPTLRPDAPVFVLRLESGRVDRIIGGLDPQMLSPLTELELETQDELWIVQPEIAALGARHPLISDSALSSLGLQARESEPCQSTRYSESRHQLQVPLGDESRWLRLGDESTFDASPAPPFAPLLEWTLPVSEASCPLTEPVFKTFGAELRMFAPDAAPPPTFSIAGWKNLRGVSRIDDDHVLAVTYHGAYVFVRGEQRRDFEGPRVLAARQLVPDLQFGLGVYFNNVLFLPEPIPRAVLSLAEVDQDGASVYGFVFEAELTPEGFGTATLIREGSDTGVLIALDAFSYAAIGGEAIVMREGLDPARVRSVPSSVSLQRATVDRERGLIALGGNGAFVWTGTREQLMQDELVTEPVRTEGGPVGATSAITGLAAIDDEGGARRFWASTFNSGALEQTEDRSWVQAETEFLPEARSCLGGPDECGFLRGARRYQLALSTPSGDVLLIPGDCSESVMWSPRRGCARRVAEQDSGLELSAGRHEGRFITVVAPDAVVLELESPP